MMDNTLASNLVLPPEALRDYCERDMKEIVGRVNSYHGRERLSFRKHIPFYQATESIVIVGLDDTEAPDDGAWLTINWEYGIDIDATINMLDQGGTNSEGID